MRRSVLLFKVRTAVATDFRISLASNFSRFPAPARASLFAFMPAGRCNRASSHGFARELSRRIEFGTPSGRGFVHYRRSAAPSNPRTTTTSDSTPASGPSCTLISIMLSIIPAAVQFFARFLIRFFFTFGGTLVVKLLTSGYRDLALDPAVLHVQFSGDERESLFLDLALKLVDFLPMEKEFAFPHRLVILTIAMRVLADVRIEQPSLITLDVRVAFFELHFAAFCGFYFRPGERNSSFVFFEQVVVVPGLAVIA